MPRSRAAARWRDARRRKVFVEAVRVAVLTTPVRSTVLDDLRELVAALDRRVPRLEREGECDIARDASDLRAAALRRIRELEQADVHS